MTALILCNGSPGALEVFAPGSAVALSNFNDVGVLGWQWVLTDKPPGSTAALGSGTGPTDGFTIDVPGSYRATLRTYKDAARTILDAAASTVAFFRYVAPPTWRLPAAGETTEVNALRGWADEVNAILAEIQALFGGGGGGGKRQAAFVVGCSAVGDTLAVCDYLDTGDGTAIEAAILAASFVGGDVFVRRGTYGSGAFPPFTPAPGTRLIGAGSNLVTIVGSTTQRDLLSGSTGTYVSGFTLYVPQADPGSSGGIPLVLNDASCDDIVVDATDIDPTDLSDSLFALAAVLNGTRGRYVRGLCLKAVSRLNAGHPTALYGLGIINCDRMSVEVTTKGCDHAVFALSPFQVAIKAIVEEAVYIGIELSGGIESTIAASSVQIDASSWGNPCYGIVVDGNARRNAITGNTVNQIGVGFGVALISSGILETGNNTVTGNVVRADALASAIDLAVTEAGSVVVGNSVPGGAVTDAGSFNEIAHNPTYVIP